MMCCHVARVCRYTIIRYSHILPPTCPSSVARCSSFLRSHAWGTLPASFFLTHVLLAATRVDVDFIITAFSSRRASVSAIYLSSGRTSASHFHRRRSLFWSVNEQCVEFSETLGFKKKWSHVRYFSWSRGDINLPQVLGVSACSSSGIAGRLFAGGWPRHCCFCGVWSSVHELNGFFLFNTKWGGKDN